jgi:alpha-tubulin suppressor-like RCC1 family protein
MIESDVALAQFHSGRRTKLVLCVLLLVSLTGGAPSTGGKVHNKLVAKAVAAGGEQTCAVLTDGAVKCWGNNQFGQLGDGTTKSSSVPVTVSTVTNAIDVEIGDCTCALLSGGRVQCWSKRIESPASVPGITNATAIAVGGLYACAALADGTVQCWGSNDYSQLGNGSNTPGSKPSKPGVVMGITNATAVAAGAGHSCALLSDGAIRCWGRNDVGQVGDGSKTERSVPTPVA